MPLPSNTGTIAASTPSTSPASEQTPEELPASEQPDVLAGLGLQGGHERSRVACDRELG